jgi:hypothetical protein
MYVHGLVAQFKLFSPSGAHLKIFYQNTFLMLEAAAGTVSGLYMLSWH